MELGTQRYEVSQWIGLLVIRKGKKPRIRHYKKLLKNIFKRVTFEIEVDESITGNFSEKYFFSGPKKKHDFRI